MYIRQDVTHRLLKQSSCASSHEIAVFELNGMLFAAAYLRNGRQAEGMNVLQEMCHGHFESRIIMGDLDANFVRNNAASRALTTWFDHDERLFILNDPDVFTFCRPRCSPSVLDYCIVSRALVNRSDLQVIQDFHSDHRPILLSLGLNADRLKGNYSDLFPVRSLNLHLRPVPDGFSDKLDELIAENGHAQLHTLMEKTLRHQGVHRRRKNAGRLMLPSIWLR